MDLDIKFAETTQASLLGAIAFGRRPPGLNCAMLAVGMRPVGPDMAELWTTSDPVRTFKTDGFGLAKADGLLFGTGSFVQRTDLQTLARDVYTALFRTIVDEGCPALVRVHNYLPRITATEGGTERYRLFNEGRHEAFEAAGRSAYTAPAATAVGLPVAALQISFLAASVEAEPVENPRQVSAFAYPQRYGRSPTFSRATILRRTGGALLFVSGTASIVGHESLHPGDVAAQAREAWRNVEAILDVVAGRGWRSGAPQALKIYLRDPRDLAAVQDALRSEPRTQAALFLHAPLCRDDLLVEMEAVFPLSPA